MTEHTALPTANSQHVRLWLDTLALELVRAERRSRDASPTIAGLTETGTDPATLATIYARAVAWFEGTGASVHGLEPWGPRSAIIQHAAERTRACGFCLAPLEPYALDLTSTYERKPDHAQWCPLPF